MGNNGQTEKEIINIKEHDEKSTVNRKNVVMV